MKKYLIVLTGIVFLVAILNACGGSPQDSNGIHPITPEQRPPIPWENLDTVTIYLVEAFKVNDTMHLRMYDSNDTSHIVVDNLTTYVRDSTLVIWRVAAGSNIKKIIKIKPKHLNGDIMPGAARGFLTPRKKKHWVPVDQVEEAMEDYSIKIKHTDGNKYLIDPYLKVPRKL